MVYLTTVWAMGKPKPTPSMRVPSKAKAAFARMSFNGEGDGKAKKGNTWKQKQRLWVMAGLRALRAPLARAPVFQVGSLTIGVGAYFSHKTQESERVSVDLS